MATATTAQMITMPDLETGERSPLMSKAGNNTNTNNNKPLKPMDNSVLEKAVAGAGVVSFSTSVLAMLLERNPVIYISGLIGAGIAPYAVLQQQKITQVEALAETNKRVEEEVNQLKDENVKLQAQLVDLNKSVSNLKTMKEKLEIIQGVQGTSVEELEHQLQESRTIYSKMERNLQGEILQNLISVILACDQDGDMVLSNDEIDDIILKLEGIHNLDLDEDMIRAKVQDCGRSLNAIMEVAKNLLRDDIPEEENIFHFIKK